MGIQSDEAMIGMQNGCICCTLQSDLVDQIIKLTQKKQFNYILIEASGVSEPHEIAPLFELEDHDRDHEDGEEADEDHEGHDHSKPQLGEVARLDTCVTLIDSADFYNNLGSMRTFDECDVAGTIAELMMDQVEFANVILLNKGDLVNEEHQNDIREKLEMLNPKAKIMKSIQSKIDVMEILDTKLYKDKDEFWVTSTKTAQAMEERAERGGGPEACTARFDIKSFVYRARKPFHPGRLNDLLLEPFFMDPWVTLEDEEEGEEAERTEEEQKKLEELKQKELEKVQEEAMVKQKKRTELMGELLRSKGFLWMATAHDVIGGWQQAGNVLRIEPENQWMCLVPDIWRGTSSEAAVLEDLNKPSGEEWEYQDRRQEIVFIGHGMKTAAIQDLLDQCLLTEKEMALGPEQWKETMQHLDNINLVLEKQEEEEEEGEEGEEDEEKEEMECENKLGKRKK